jgi:hypothetical protein
VKGGVYRREDTEITEKKSSLRRVTLCILRLVIDKLDL